MSSTCFLYKFFSQCFYDKLELLLTDFIFLTKRHTPSVLYHITKIFLTGDPNAQICIIVDKLVQGDDPIFARELADESVDDFFPRGFSVVEIWVFGDVEGLKRCLFAKESKPLKLSLESSFVRIQI